VHACPVLLRSPDAAHATSGRGWHSSPCTALPPGLYAAMVYAGLRRCNAHGSLHAWKTYRGLMPHPVTGLRPALGTPSPPGLRQGMALPPFQDPHDPRPRPHQAPAEPDPSVIQPGPSALSSLHPISGRALPTEGTLAEPGEEGSSEKGRREGDTGMGAQNPGTAPRSLRHPPSPPDLVLTTGPSL